MLAFIFGLIVLLMQVPHRPANPSLRISGSDGAPLATLSPEVLSQVLSKRTQGTGSPSKPWNQADTSIASDCGVEWTVAELSKQLNEDVATSLGTPHKQFDVLVRLTHAVSSKSTSKAVTGQPSPKITGTGTGA